MSGDQIESFAGNDVQFADSLRFLSAGDILDQGDSQNENTDGSRPLAATPDGAEQSDAIGVASRADSTESSSASDVR
jgi:hypothetical protein